MCDITFGTLVLVEVKSVALVEQKPWCGDASQELPVHPC